MEFFSQNFSLALSKGESLPSPNLHLPHEEEPDTDQNNHRKPTDEYVPKRRILFFFRINDYLLIPEKFNHLRVFRGVGFKMFSFCIYPINISTLSLYFLNPIVLYCRNKIGIIFI